MRRSDKRKLVRRRFHRKNLKNMKYSRYHWELAFMDGNRRLIRLAFRAGKTRHQPRRVREIVHGKRQCHTRAEQESINRFTDLVVKATWCIALGADEDRVMNTLHHEMKQLHPESIE